MQFLPALESGQLRITFRTSSSRAVVSPKLREYDVLLCIAGGGAIEDVLRAQVNNVASLFLLKEDEGVVLAAVQEHAGDVEGQLGAHRRPVPGNKYHRLFSNNASSFGGRGRLPRMRGGASGCQHFKLCLLDLLPTPTRAHPFAFWA